MKYKIITTKSSYTTDDKNMCNYINTYFTKISFGKKMPFAMVNLLEGGKVSINPQYVVAIEELKSEINIIDIIK